MTGLDFTSSSQVGIQNPRTHRIVNIVNRGGCLIPHTSNDSISYDHFMRDPAKYLRRCAKEDSQPGLPLLKCTWEWRGRTKYSGFHGWGRVIFSA